ncbi:hypothetical protein PYCCODRAFT_713440 [Trametes coccinea BRFM310]|uniref:Uncharacterized protein n=1 Tax=Trametes coccinea (strain BRFM310) TaxID=1353009 RepID=A0A1Y2IJ63_TRAC3|nr:hypothetical protein PYCCODRAFT_713440 [Trametes coccinea BRFM310]
MQHALSTGLTSCGAPTLQFGSSPPGWPRPWSRQMQRAAAFAFAPLMTGELRPISGTLNLCMGRGLQVRRRRQC